MSRVRTGYWQSARQLSDDVAVNMSLTDQLQDIVRIPHAARRGRALESFVADLFRQAKFRVRPDPRAAKPRQTDILASKVGDVYLIECKWRSDKANIDDLDSLRSRLRRIEGGA